MLRAAGGPARVLMGDIVVYVKQLVSESNESNLAFFQSLIEAATRMPLELMVGPLPVSGAIRCELLDFSYADGILVSGRYHGLA